MVSSTSSVGVSVVTLIIIFVTKWIYRWRNPKCNGTLPPGSSGLPVIGESLQLIIPANTIDVLPFIKNRLRRYGPLFRTNVAGTNIVISADREFNHFLFQQEDTMVIFGEFGARKLYGRYAERSKEFTHKFVDISRAAMSFPLNIPGTTYYKCLKAEHDAIIKKRSDPDSSVTWEEYKSMTFTLQVVNETQRMANTIPGFFRKAIKDINEYEAEFICKNLTPFGEGKKQCAGADFSRAAMCIFLHVLVSKYRWTIVKGGDFVQNPMLHFKNGLYISVTTRQD
ncbi:hypothetical protein C2S51_038513 [Perilla frutescens var. frutescens]|nr:hypothetical protein C2S51_038513 [Perilla frutescens var. frutescens]